MKQLLAITQKELKGYFGSPMALIFIGTFLAVTLFAFFWVDTFFARGIADIRPLFRSMPLLMIFLVAVLTMRQWSEEERSGTLEILLTLPVSHFQLVMGKFLAVLTLIAISLALTLFLPITVSLLGNLDWGPVIGGYIAAIMLAAAYTAIGLFVSSRTDNQIVSMNSTLVLGGLFYLVGSAEVTDFAGNVLGEVLRAMGAGSRFESIQRGVIDLRDLIYYVSLSGVFLILNVVSLIGKRWSQSRETRPQRRAVVLTSALLVLNLVQANVWTYSLLGLRIDLTKEHEYTLSQTTKDMLIGLQEPLLLRGYFSEKTHPQLATLVPAVRDMMREYEIASRGKVQLEFVDPATDPEKEAEANQVYGIRSVPFRVVDRYESSVINSYFDILVRYGNQSKVLAFSDLIEIEPRREGIDVRLRNLEYDLTSSIKKVVFGFQSVDAALAAMNTPVELTIYFTPDTLSESLTTALATMTKVAEDIASRSNGKFTYRVVDPDAPDSPVTPQELYERYGIEPFAASILSGETYYLHMVLEIGGQARVMYPREELSEADVRSAIESALRRASPGFLKVVGLWTPPAEPTLDVFGRMQQPIASWQELESSLRQEYEVHAMDLSTGQVPGEVNVLVIVAPENMTDMERFAIDQFLMRGGSVIVAGGNYAFNPDQVTGSLMVRTLEDGLGDMLKSYGIDVEEKLVMDPQSEAFPVPVTRVAAGQQIQEFQAVNYPFFVDVRSDGMASDSPIVSNLFAVTLNWVSPVTVDEEKNADRQVTTLLQSSPDSWTKTETGVQPNFRVYPDLGFPVGDEQQSYPLAVSIQGVFESYFRDRAPSTVEDEAEEEGEGAEEENLTEEPLPGTIEVSPETARLIVIGSNEFLDDVVFNISSTLGGDRYLNSLQFLRNAVSWATEDLDLLSIRSRGTSARILKPITEREQSLWEGANYMVALLALATIGIVWNIRSKREAPITLIKPETDTKRKPAQDLEEEQ
jgi:ABC-2 type transport system permease protein